MVSLINHKARLVQGMVVLGVKALKAFSKNTYDANWK
jgi:hypothetical protein